MLRNHKFIKEFVTMRRTERKSHSKILGFIISLYLIVSPVYAANGALSVSENNQLQEEISPAERSIIDTEISKEVSPEENAGKEGSEDASVKIDIMPLEKIVRISWEASHKGDLDGLDRIVADVILYYGEDARQQQDSLSDFPERGKEDGYKALNDVATVLFIRAEALMNYGRTESAVRKFEEIIADYKWAQSWDPRGWFWSVAEKSQDSIDVMQGKVIDDEETPPEVLKTLPKLFFKGLEEIIDYTEFGEFVDVGTDRYNYKVNDPEGLSEAIGEGIYPNNGSVKKNPGYQEAKVAGRLKGSHWEYVNSDDLEAAFYKWATAPEPVGVKLFYLGHVLEKAKMYYEAIKAYHALIVHFPRTNAKTYWQTPWYPAQAAIAKIKHIVRTHPELELTVKWMKIKVTNGFDNDVSNDNIVIYPGKISKRTLWDKVLERFDLKKDAVALDKVKKVIGKGKVQLVQYDNGHWQMLVDGEPFIMKGVTYAPTKIGQSPDKGTLVSWMYEDSNNNGLADGPYDVWVDANKNGKKDADEPVVGDFRLIKEMGGNTIREYHQPIMPNKKFLREMHKKYGFYVVMGDYLGKYTLGSGATWFEGTDYENPKHQASMMASVKRMVVEFKDEPYVLLWVLGNENNYGIASNADQKPEAYFKFANEVAKMIKSIDPNHPVAICNGDTLYLDIFAKNAPDVDIFAANVYRGDYGFGSFWEQIADAADKPAFITEFGCPAYAKHLTYAEAEDAQADYHRGNWLDIDANLAGKASGAGNALGGIVFEWTDEWWKSYEPFYHDKKSDAVGPFPGGFYFEEWFGITSQGKGNDSPFLRQLRKSYFVYKDLWNK